MSIEFTPFPKIGRLRRGITVTEKLDGTNAAVRIVPMTGENYADLLQGPCGIQIVEGHAIFAQSRTRFITPGKLTDNYGFAEWVQENASDLVKLGPGIHYGEWWGQGIQRRYGLAEKRFSLFNTERWRDGREERPACCGVVPILYEGDFDPAQINGCMSRLAVEGSAAAPGFMNPEGIVIFHSAIRTNFKITFEHDEHGKEAA